jgi:hypothetical protein
VLSATANAPGRPDIDQCEVSFEVLRSDCR